MGAEGDSSESRLGVNRGEEEEVMINIRCSNGTKFTVRTSLESTVGSFKAVLAQNCDIPADQQRLIYKGRILKDDQTLQSYGKFYLPLEKNVGFVFYLWVFRIFDGNFVFYLWVFRIYI